MLRSAIRVGFLCMVIQAAAPGTTAACGFWDPTGACGAVKELGLQTKQTLATVSEELRVTRAALKETVDIAAKAVPGERWARILEGLGSPDAKVREETRQQLRRLAGDAEEAIPKRAYELVVAFDFDDSKHFRAYFNRYNTASRSVVEALVAQGSLNLEHAPSRTPLSPISLEDLRLRLMARAEEVVSQLTGPVEKSLKRIHRAALSTMSKVNVSA